VLLLDYKSGDAKSPQIAVAAHMSIGVGNQRMGFCKKTIPLCWIGCFRGARHELRCLQALRDTGAPVRSWIVGRHGRPHHLTDGKYALAR